MYWDVIVASIASIILGFVWYGPLFGKSWMKEVGWTPQKMKKISKKPMGPTYFLMAVSTLVSVLVLKTILFSFPFGQSTTLCYAVILVWIGFFVPLSLSAVLWEAKSWKLFFINASYYLVNLSISAKILSLF
jgi:hypothetical protein